MALAPAGGESALHVLTYFWASCCANFASMPLDADSVFIRPSARAAMLESIVAEASQCR